eukprot:864715_1
MSRVEKRQFSDENHRPSLSERFKKQQQANKKTNGNNNNKKQSNQKKKSKPKIEKYSVEWIRERSQHIAMMKLQMADNDNAELIDTETLTLQILELIHNIQYSDNDLQA